MVGVRATWLLGFLLLLACNDSLAQTTKRAVLVGINAYQASGVSDLNGTANDVHLVKTLLVNRFGFAPEDITVLLDGAATHAGILGAINRDLAQKSDADDVAVFYFSGHGSQMGDESRDEPDGWDETLVAADSRIGEVRDISDDELNVAFAAVAARTQNLTIFLDSCHSGNAIRATNGIRRAPPDPNAPQGPAGMAATGTRSIDGAYDVMGLGERYVLISGSRSEELSNEDQFGGKMQGALTYHFVHAAQADPKGTYRSVFPKVVDRVNSQFPSQTPQLEGPGRDSQIFDTKSGSGGNWIVVNPEPGARARLQAGTLYGIHPGATVSIFPPGDSPTTVPAIATLKVDVADLDTASGALVGAQSIPAYSRARIDALPFDGQARTVWLEPAVADALRSSIAAGLVGFPSLRLLDGSTASMNSADFRIYPVKAFYEIVGRDGIALTATVPQGDVNAGGRLLDQLHDWSRWQSLHALRNPYGSLQVAVDIRPAGSAPGTTTPTSVQSGTPIDVEVQNLSDVPLYFALLDLSSNGEVALLFPAVGAQDTIPARSRLQRTFSMKAPAGRPWIRDTFKVIASTTPIDGSVFRQGAIRDVPPQAPPPPLARMIRNVATAMPRQAELIEMKDWTTAERSIRIDRGGPRFAGVTAPAFALHFPAPADITSVETSLNTGPRAVCPAGVPCATVKPLSADRRIVEVSATTLRAKRRVRADTAVDSIGQAFEDAYYAADITGASYAEPLITLTTQDAPDAPPAPGMRGGDTEPDPIALADDRWSLKYAAVPAAWERVRGTGLAEGGEAAGIFVGHPDTGYTRHPENWAGSDGLPIDALHDHDYIENDDDAVDTLSDEGVLSNPGHGTGSGSVIVSPDGCQLTGTTQCVSGVARGARLMPFRVHTSVVVFDTSNLARAIDDAASGRWGQKADVVSIAMGGPPSRTLHKAVRNATRNGVLVVAAAGNYVRTVVWPARFRESIAVSAINPRCIPWTHASRGGAVDFSAPGEGVWRATTKAPANYGAGMGAGTTFATGTTAGIAALWLSYHRDDPRLASLKASGKAAEVFRTLVQRTAWRPGDATRPPPSGVSCASDQGWNARKYGAGVINAAELLAADLSAAGTRSPAVPSAVELFATLYAEEASNDRIERDYRAIFPSGRREEAERFETEIMYHYTNSDEVRLAIDEVVEGAGAGGDAPKVRANLLSQDLSTRLRTALQVRVGGPP